VFPATAAPDAAERWTRRSRRECGPIAPPRRVRFDPLRPLERVLPLQDAHALVGREPFREQPRDVTLQLETW
jgi:hypothetical protein